MFPSHSSHLDFNSTLGQRKPERRVCHLQSGSIQHDIPYFNKLQGIRVWVKEVTLWDKKMTEG